MGLSLNELALLAEWTDRYGLRGHIATLGVPALHFSAAELSALLGDNGNDVAGGSRLHATDIYRRLGFSQASYLDVSDYEGADIVLDLNVPEIPAYLSGAFDVVLDCGTLEHIFHLPNALLNVVRMTKLGGHVLHIVLMDNGVDHGYYQLSPTVFFDWFEAAGLEVREAAALSFDALDFRDGLWSVRHVRRGTFGGGELGLAQGETKLFLVLARKLDEITVPQTPIQYLYRTAATPNGVNPRWFPAFRMRAGRAFEDVASVCLEITNFIPDEGFAWRCELPETVPLGITSTDRCSSDLLLLEDGRPLGPMNWAHPIVRARGCGAYSHAGRTLVFSTSDNSSPLANRRRYTVWFKR